MSTIEYVRKLGFTNVQDYINSEAHGTINPSRLKRMVTFMTNNGWVEVPKLDGDFDFEFSPRDLIKYVTNNKPKDGGIRNIININLNIWDYFARCSGHSIALNSFIILKNNIFSLISK